MRAPVFSSSLDAQSPMFGFKNNERIIVMSYMNHGPISMREELRLEYEVRRFNNSLHPVLLSYLTCAWCLVQGKEEGGLELWSGELRFYQGATDRNNPAKPITVRDCLV